MELRVQGSHKAGLAPSSLRQELFGGKSIREIEYIRSSLCDFSEKKTKNLKHMSICLENAEIWVSIHVH